MKKSEALKTLGLSEGATPEEIKKAHRKLAIENHPDRFGQDAEARAKAEERMKLINEARDVLESGKWEPENANYGTPFTYDPFTGSPTSERPSGTNPTQDPFFGGFPFGNGSFVWTTYSSDGTTRTYTSDPRGNHANQAGNQENGHRQNPNADPFGGFDPFFGSAFSGSPFNPFAGVTAEAQLASETSDLKKELGFIGAKVLLALGAALFVSPALALYLYVIGSIAWALYHNMGFLSSFLIVPFVLLALVFAPGPLAVVGFFGLLTFVIAFVWDCDDLYKRVKLIRGLKRKIGA